MTIRKGIYTIYKGIEMSIVQYYGHGISDPDIENHRKIVYEKEMGLLEGFKLNNTKNKYYKDVHIKELKNVYKVTTKASFKGSEMEVYNFFNEENAVGLITYIKTNDSNFVESVDNFGKKYFIGMVKLSEIEEIWEERTKSEFDLPMPEGIETKKRIFPVN